MKFKVGDRVRSNAAPHGYAKDLYGTGTIISIDPTSDYPYTVKYDGDKHGPGPTLQAKEWSLRRAP